MKATLLKTSGFSRFSEFVLSLLFLSVIIIRSDCVICFMVIVTPYPNPLAGRDKKRNMRLHKPMRAGTRTCARFDSGYSIVFPSLSCPINSAVFPKKDVYCPLLRYPQNKNKFQRRCTPACNDDSLVSVRSLQGRRIASCDVPSYWITSCQQRHRPFLGRLPFGILVSWAFAIERIDLSTHTFSASLAFSQRQVPWHAGIRYRSWCFWFSVPRLRIRAC